MTSGVPPPRLKFVRQSAIIVVSQPLVTLFSTLSGPTIDWPLARRASFAERLLNAQQFKKTLYL